MSRNWDQTLKDWAETIHVTDEARGSGAREAINKAIRGAPTLAQKRFEVIVTGSYKNNTNIRANSDVDVAVVLRDVCFYTFPADGSVTREMLGIKDSEYTFDAWRTDVGAALVAHFGKASVREGNKAFDVRATGQRLEADVAVFLEHRLYTGKKMKSSPAEWEHLDGIAMLPRKAPSERIANWPEQHVDSGIAKNEATNRRFKRMVRIFKHLRADMGGQGDAEQQSAAGQVSSFALECLVFNAPNACFDPQAGGWIADTRAVLTWLIGATKPGADASKLVEVSGRESLFRTATGRTQSQAYAFVSAAWRRIFDQAALPC